MRGVYLARNFFLSKESGVKTRRRRRREGVKKEKKKRKKKEKKRHQSPRSPLKHT
jgi:hypothetical protein